MEQESVTPRETTETQKQARTQDTSMDTQDVLVIHKKYSQKKIRFDRTKTKGLTVSLCSFVRDIHVFDADISARYTNKRINEIMKLVFKKVADRIIKKLWRMPFPNGIGSLYMKEAQVRVLKFSATGEVSSVAQIESLLREVEFGMKRVFLKWNKQGRRFSYMRLWHLRASKGYFRSIKFNEIIERAEDVTRKNYRGHII